MDKKIKWGVIGSGGIARRRTIPEGITKAPHAVLSAVYDPDTKANSEVAAQFGAVAVESIEALLASDVDAVYIASPVNMHHSQVLAAAKAGKHILCEKSLGMNSAQVEEMIAACEKAGVLFSSGFMMRFIAQHRAVKEMIAQGHIGKPVYGRAQLSCWYPPIEGAWRQDPALGGGGSLVDMGSHCIDLLEMFFGKVKRVACFTANSVHGYASEDSALCTLFFESGAMGSVDVFFCIPDNSSKNILEIYGSKGSILARGSVGQGAAGEMTAWLESDSAGYDAAQTRTSSEGVAIAPEAVNPYMAEIEEVNMAILEGRKPANDASIGLQNQKIVEACYDSARTGRIIEL